MLDTNPSRKPEHAGISFEPTPELKRFLHRLPTAMAKRLTPEELAAYAKALVPQRSPHWIDFKGSIPIPGFGIYIALMVGRERRDRERLRREGQLGVGRNLVIAAVLLGTILTGWLSAVLLLKGLVLMAGDDHDIWWNAYARNL